MRVFFINLLFCKITKHRIVSFDLFSMQFNINCRWVKDHVNFFICFDDIYGLCYAHNPPEHSWILLIYFIFVCFLRHAMTCD
jgi:hypothetical protein